jgi:5-methylcytosine-specific restriction protein A
MSSVTFRGDPVSRADVLRALAEFDAAYGDDTNAYDGWLDKGVYRYALHVGGRLYPPKHILSVISGISTTDFSGGEQTNRVFRQLGFDVREK